jgi:CubicO group peptidase (beta-lactamase class C family)
MTQRLLRVGALITLSAFAVACSGSDGGTAVADPTVSVAGPTAVATTTVPTTAAPTTVAPSTTAAPGTTAASTTVAPSTTLAAPSGGVFPGVDWETAPFPADVDRAAVDAAVDVAFGAPDATARVQSIVVVQGGTIVYERYHPLDDADEVMTSFSVAKSFTSSLIGLVVGDGLLDITEPAPVALWDDPADPRHAITTEHLLHMASGLDWSEEYSGAESPVLAMLSAPDASASVASRELEAAPGEKFEYSTGTTAILAGIATDLLGGPDAADDYFRERLLDPIGITSIEFMRDTAGRWLGGIGANQTTRDFARFGLLYLNDGIWDGVRILPEGWVEYSHTPSATNPRYGAQWWMLHPDSFEARGLFGQIVLVSQTHDLVIAINTTAGGDSDTLIDTVYPLFAGTA